MVADSLREQVARIQALSEDMQAIEKRLSLKQRQNPQMQRIAQIPGVVFLTATAAIATTRNPRQRATMLSASARSTTKVFKHSRAPHARRSRALAKPRSETKRC